MVTTASSRGVPSSLVMRPKRAVRAGASARDFEKMASAQAMALGPLMRMTARAPPGAVAGAQMVGVLFKTYGLGGLYAGDDVAGDDECEDGDDERGHVDYDEGDDLQ